MRLKKLIVLLLAISLLASVVACGSSPPAQDATTAAATTAAATTTAAAAATTAAAAATTAAAAQTPSNEIDPVVGVAPMPRANEPISYTLFSRDPQQAPIENEFYQKIQALTGVTIKYEFLVGDLTQKLGVMIAGGDYPDLIFAGDSLSKLIEAQALIPMENELSKYPNLWSLIDEGTLIPFMTAEDGHAYSIPSNPQLTNKVTTFRPVFEAGIGFYIQKAVLAEFGYPPLPTTVDGYFSMIEDYMALYPELYGVKTMGFEILMDDWRNWGLRAPVGCLMGQSNQGEVFVDDANNYKVSSYHINQEAKDYYQRLNQAYLNGIVDPATFTKSYDEYIASLATGAVLGFFDQTWNFNNGQTVLRNDNKFERTYVAVPVAAPGYQDAYMDLPSGNPDAVNGIALTQNCKDVDRILEYFDWMMQREIQDWLRWGVEGTDWVYSDDGTSRLYTPERRAIQNDPARRRDETGYYLYSLAPKNVGLYASDGMPCGSDDSADEFLANMNPAEQEFFANYNVKFPAALMSPPVQRAQYFPVWAFVLEEGGIPLITKNQINDICVKHYPRIIMSANDIEFEANWQSFLAEYNTLDLETYFAEIERQISVMMAK